MSITVKYLISINLVYIHRQQVEYHLCASYQDCILVDYHSLYQACIHVPLQLVLEELSAHLLMPSEKLSAVNRNNSEMGFIFKMLKEAYQYMQLFMCHVMSPNHAHITFARKGMLLIFQWITNKKLVHNKYSYWSFLTNCCDQNRAGGI